jgi:hypothetical protein
VQKAERAPSLFERSQKMQVRYAPLGLWGEPSARDLIDQNKAVIYDLLFKASQRHRASQG